MGALKEEVREMKKFFIATGNDPEGSYGKSFIKEVLSRTQRSGPFYRFTDKESFLKHVRSAK